MGGYQYQSIAAASDERGLRELILSMMKKYTTAIFVISVLLSKLVFAAEEFEPNGEVILIEDENTVTVSLISEEGVNPGDWMRIGKKLGKPDAPYWLGSIESITGLDAIVKIESEAIEVGMPALSVSRAIEHDADSLTAIPGDTFAVTDGVEDDKIDLKKAIPQIELALSEYPDESRFHTQLGRLLELQRKPAQAILSYERALEIERYYPLACHRLATLRYHGPEELRDFKIARELFNRASQLGFEASMPVIGAMNRDGVGGDQDYEAAFNWFKIAAEVGNAYSQNALGECFENAWGVDQDIGKALLWYRSAAELGFAPAMRNLGRAFAKGVGVTRNDKTAFDWYAKAGELNDSEALLQLAIFYRHGRGVKPNYEYAMELLNRAAKRGKADAMRELAEFFQEGIHVRKSYELAASWYLKAAKKGDPASQFNLALLYERGQGVEKSKADAVYWYQDAARNGHQGAQKRLLKMNQSW